MPGKVLPRRRLLQGLAGAAAATLVAPAALLWSVTASAHRSHVSLTRLTPNPRASTWEVVHYLHYHDCRELLQALLPQRPVEPGSDEGKARLALYVEQRFSLSGPGDKPLTVQTVGAEVVGDSVAVYRELPLPGIKGDYTVSTTMLCELFADQINNVSLEFAKPSQTLMLTAQQSRATFAVY
jgi:hypothetical protein